VLTGCSGTVEGQDGSGGAGDNSGSGGGDNSTAQGDPDAGGAGSQGAGGSSNIPPGRAVGSVSDYADPGLYQVDGTNFLIGRDAGGLYALSAICTHDACNMNSDGQITGTGIMCDCHGSIFNTQGSVIRGPARRALTAYAVAADDAGNLYVNPSNVVSASVRLKV
jgi:Rieske Fe-S protein